MDNIRRQYRSVCISCGWFKFAAFTCAYQLLALARKMDYLASSASNSSFGGAETFDKNFGVALACCDWFFATLHHSEEYSKREAMEFGLGSSTPMTNHRLKDLYLAPFKELGLPLFRPLITLLQNRVKRRTST